MNEIRRRFVAIRQNGVEFKTMGDVCKFRRGTMITAKNTVGGDVPVIAGGQTPAYYHNVANRTGETISCKIPVPSLAEQNGIVAILNKFDAMANDISAGLPSEIRARRRHYEYYRDKLLTFDKT